MDEEDVRDLIAAIRSISHGPTSGPMGLEMLSMAINGSGGVGENSLAEAVSMGLGEIASSTERGLNEIANAIRFAARHIASEGTKN